jgi:hypothetical protein
MGDGAIKFDVMVNESLVWRARTAPSPTVGHREDTGQTQKIHFRCALGERSGPYPAFRRLRGIRQWSRLVQIDPSNSLCSISLNDFRDAPQKYEEMSNMEASPMY